MYRDTEKLDEGAIKRETSDTERERSRPGDGMNKGNHTVHTELQRRAQFAWLQLYRACANCTC